MPALACDLNIVMELWEEGIEQKDVLKIVDAHRILQDISHYLFQDGGIVVNNGVLKLRKTWKEAIIW